MDTKVSVHGLVVHPDTGKLDIIVDGYKYNSENKFDFISREINKSRFLFTGIGFLF